MKAALQEVEQTMNTQYTSKLNSMLDGESARENKYWGVRGVWSPWE